MDRVISEYKKYFKLKNGYEVTLQNLGDKVSITEGGKTTEHTESELKKMIENIKTWL